MSHHGDVTTVQELLDDAFAGAVDPRELISKMDDPSDFHVPTNLKVRKKKMVVKPTPSVAEEIKKGMERIANHRRMGAITSEQALAMFDELVSKAAEKPTKKRKKVADDAHVAAVAATWGESTRQQFGDTADVRSGQPNPAPVKGGGTTGAVKDKAEDPQVKQAKLERKVDEIVPKPKKIDPKLLDAAPPQPAFAGPMAAPPQGAPVGPPQDKAKGKVSKSGPSQGTGERRAGLALNALAVGSGIHGTYLAAKETGRALKDPVTMPKTAATLAKAPGLKRIAEHPKAAAATVGGALVGLHLAELGGDYIANRALRQKPKAKTPETLAKRAEVEWVGEISKVNTDKRLVFGWCSISKVDGKPVVDLQGDYVPISTTEDAAYRYVIHSRKGGDMHERVSKRTGFLNRDEPLHTSDLVESMVFTAEKLEALGLPPNALPEAWWVGFQVNDDEQWRKVKAGERPGFSIHGSGARVPISA